MPFVLALDQGTTSSRSLVFDVHGTLVASAQKPHRQIYPQSGWVELDPLESFDPPDSDDSDDE